MDTLYSLSFAAGFFGGFGHCIGMCGPIATAYTLPANGGWAGLLSLRMHLIYGAGRVTTYAFVGALMGLSGAFVDTAGRLAGIRNLAPVLAGMFMIAAGLHIAGLLNAPVLAGWREGRLLKTARLIIEAESVWKFYPLGLLLGFIPCGLSYPLFLGAAGSGDLLQGMTTMICFGIGTLPAMLLFGSLVGFLGDRLKNRLYRVSGIVVILMGLFFFARVIRLHV